MTTYVINREDVQKEVVIRNIASGKEDIICVQPQSKAKIAEGCEVPKNFLLLNKKIQITSVPSPVQLTPVATPKYVAPRQVEETEAQTSSKK